MQILVPLWRVPFGLSFTLYPIELDREHIYTRQTNPTSINPLVKISMYVDGIYQKDFRINVNRSVYIDVEYEHLLLPNITYKRNAY